MSPLVRRAVGVAVAAGLISTVALVVQASALAALVGGLFAHADAGWARDVTWFVAATVARAMAVGLGDPVIARVARPIRRELRRRTLETVLDDGPVGGIDATVQLLTRGVDAVENYVARFVPTLMLSALAPAVLLAWLWWRDWLSALIVAISLALLPIFMVLLGMEARAKMTERWREQQQLAGYFGDVVRGMTVLKSFNRSRNALAHLDDVGASLRRTTMATLRVAFLSSFALELLSTLATAMVALTLGLRLLNGSLHLNVALAVLLVTPEVFLPLRRAAAQFHASADGVAAADELLDLVERPRHRGTARPPHGAPTIELAHVAIVRADRRDTLTVDAVLPAGSLTTVIGPSGSGKTTLLRVLAGLAVPDSGHVLIDGTELAEYSREQWRTRVAWLSQDPLLPGASVGEAMRMGTTTLSDEQLLTALAAVGLELDLGRPLGEGALELSAGQRRRVALARCLVRRPALLLLDEPTSHLDRASAELVERVVSQLTMTRLVATHRPFASDAVIDLSNLVHHG
ncbi:MAG: thiol reductant ABC exporter subunit CydD [Acidimicrobiales bacterium]